MAANADDHKQTRRIVKAIKQKKVNKEKEDKQGREEWLAFQHDVIKSFI